MSESALYGRGTRYVWQCLENWKTGLIAGQNGWTSAVTLAGTVTIVGAPPVLQIATVLTLNAGACVRQDVGAWDTSNAAIHEIEWTVALSHVPSAGEPFFSRFGLLDQNFVDGTDGAWFFASSASLNWQCVTAAAGVITTTATAVPLVADPTYAAPVRLGIRLVAGQAIFFINGVAVVVHTTNIPGTGQFWGAVANIRKDAATLGITTPAAGIRRSEQWRQEGQALTP